MRASLVILLLFLSTQASAIFGGAAAGSRGAVTRHTVAIVGELKGGELYICSGTVVAPHLVLTAAHCTNGEKLRVIFSNNALGELDSGRGNLVKPVVGKPSLPPGARMGGDVLLEGPDLALLGFAGALPQGYEPVELQLNPEEVRERGTVVAAGYGQTEPDADGKQGILHFVALKIRMLESGNGHALLEQKRGKGVCHGDSGAPVFTVKNKTLFLWGIVNGGSDSNGCEDFGVVTKVQEYGDWLSKVIKQKAKRP